MPQPPLEIANYLSTPLPAIREQFPPGTGGTGPRAEWPEGTLKGVQVIDGFEDEVVKYIGSLPTEPVPAHPAHKYPKFLQVISSLPHVIKSPSDLQKCLSTLPLAAVSSVLTALEADSSDLQTGHQSAQALDRAGYESDGGEEDQAAAVSEGKTKAFQWRFNKSPMGSGEFLLLQQGSEEVKMVVRTINSSALTPDDWDEFVVTGPYHYTTKSKASWYWSRQWGACRRLNCRFWALTDYQRWVFGVFDEKREHSFVSPLQDYDVVNPSILQELFYWARSATGDEKGFKREKKDVSGLPALFPPNPARRVSVSGGKKPRVNAENKVRAANESDIEESDAEGADGS